MVTESSLVTKRMPWVAANYTDSNHLGRALHLQPHKFEGVMTRIFSSYNYAENPMTSYLNQFGKEVTIQNNEWEWSLRGAHTRPLLYVGAAKTGTPGLGITEFQMELDTNWLKVGDVIHPGNTKFQVRVQSGPTSKGNHYVYTVQPMTRSASLSIPLQYLAPGAKWSKLNSQYGERSGESGSTTYSGTIELKNRLSRFRKSQSFSGDVTRDVLAVKVPDRNGKMYDSWIPYAETEFWAQWYKELERGSWYNRSTDVVQDSNGYPLRNGPGVQEQMEDSHQHYYSRLSAKLIEEFFQDIFYQRITPGPMREVVAFTGEYGMKEFHRVVNEELGRTGFINQVQEVMTDVSSAAHKNAKRFGYQFTEYAMHNGAVLKVIHNPLYDDPETHFAVDPETGIPYESMRFSIFDMSGEGATSNIRKVRKQNAYSFKYIAGMAGPAGMTDFAANPIDGYEMHVLDQCGIHIEDISKCGELLPVGLLS